LPAADLPRRLKTWQRRLPNKGEDKDMTTYNLTCVNNSNNTGSFLVFQQLPTPSANIFPLAWFTKVAAPTTKITFTWTIDYSFVWSQTGQLIPGVEFYASQNWAADLANKNKVTFTNTGQVPTFQNQGPGLPGSLQIVSDSTVPAGTFSVGVGMSGAGTFVQQAQPNWNWTYTPHPEYWVAFGSYTQGEVLDLQSMSNTAQVQFAPNVYSMTATLGLDNSWNINQLAKYNQLLLEARANQQVEHKR
jgi:hypothetical protein